MLQIHLELVERVFGFLSNGGAERLDSLWRCGTLKYGQKSWELCGWLSVAAQIPDLS
jgi:hypothetical protein